VNAVCDTAQDIFRLTRAQADTIEKQVIAVVKTWQDRANKQGMPRMEIQQMSRVFPSQLIKKFLSTQMYAPLAALKS